MALQNLNKRKLNTVSHYFINNKSITDLYGAGHFEKEVLNKLDELFEEHQLVFLVGGSGLYIDAVLNGVDDFVEVPLSVRDELNQQFLKNGMIWLQNQVKEKDADYFNDADINNPQRLIRALEVCVYTGKAYSSFLKQEKTPRNFIPIKILLNTSRDQLYTKINNRVDEMMKEGLFDEVKSLVSYKNLNALKTVGYKELYAHLDGSYNLDTAILKIKQHTRNYAKRQLTWFKHQDEFDEFEPGDLEKIKAYIDIIVAN